MQTQLLAAQLAATLEEEEATDEALTEIAKTAINQEAQVA
jgi:ferritin-like metal-binding protein YciE